MEQLAGRVAVVTGAASGIGLALARHFARERMRIVLADVEEPALQAARAELTSAGAEVIAVPTDVSNPAAVESLAEQSFSRFGAVHVLCNNAGVSAGGGATWEATPADWAWLLGVNLMGVVHGLRAFVPRMLESDEPGHLVNTSSDLGLTSGAGSTYAVSKHAVTRLTEGLYHDLRRESGGRIGVSLLCPGMVATHLVEAERNRPSELRNEPADGAATEAAAEQRRRLHEWLQREGMAPDEVARAVVEAIREERFYVLTHPDVIERVRLRMEDILEGRSPTLSP